MSFVSYSFLILFFLTLLARFTFGKNKNETSYLVFLLAASLVFYASYIPSYLLLLIGVTSVDYYLGQKIASSPSPGRSKVYVALSVVSNLGLLSYFKYFNFFMNTLDRILHWAKLQNPVGLRLDLLLPLGISFFTFQSMSYIIDIYRGELKPVKSYWRFLLFVSFFTHLVSGPIVRARELLYQFDRRRRPRLQVFLQGAYLMIQGFFLKMVVADNLASFVGPHWTSEAASGKSALVALLLVIFFSCQIFADFAGYSSIAIGSAYLLGFKLPQNFNCPYLSGTFREFWSRWHITLSHWMRDYLYIPLGGNQGSRGRIYANLLIVMLLAGLWHGAAFTFIAWGLLHGLALLTERALGFHRPDPRRPLWLGGLWFLTVQATVLVGWIFFRAESIGQAWKFVGNIFFGNWGWSGEVKEFIPGLVFTLPVLLMHLRGYFAGKQWFLAPHWVEKGILCGVMLYALFTIYGVTSAFIYYQF
jgi:alginate O-acetyltransferase complex protein AlgI